MVNHKDHTLWNATMYEDEDEPFWNSTIFYGVVLWTGFCDIVELQKTAENSGAPVLTVRDFATWGWFMCQPDYEFLILNGSIWIKPYK